MLVPGRLPLGRALSIAALGAVLCATGSLSNAASAGSCPSVADPQGIEASYPYQLDRPDFEAQTGKPLELSENPMFAEQVKAGKLPPVAERVPEEALVYLPYDDCGKYGGTLLARPTTPTATISSIAGVWAACKGVLPPSTSCGSSAQPSGIIIAYFMT